MIHLSHLNYLDTIKQIAERDPKLLYFICFRGNSIHYPIKRPLIDIQEDCRDLARKWEIFFYQPPEERPTHTVTADSCAFTDFGRQICEELIKNKICKEMVKFFKKTENDGNETSINLTKGDFEQKFFETFAFGPDPMEELEDILEEFKLKIPYINFPEKGYSLKKKGIRY